MFWRKERRELDQLRRQRDRTKRDLVFLLKWIKALPMRPPYFAKVLYRIERVLESIETNGRKGDDD